MLPGTMPAKKSAGQPIRSLWAHSWMRKFLAACVLLVVLVLAAPWIVASTPLGGWILGQVTRSFGIDASAASMDLGWFRVISLHDATLRGSDGKLLAEIKRVDSSHTLLGLLLNRDSDLGTFRFEEAKVHIDIHGDSSNVETFIYQMMQQPASNQPAPAVKLELVDGIVLMNDVDHDRHWQFEPVGLTCNFKPGTGTTYALKIDGKETGAKNGLVDVRLELPEVTQQAEASVKIDAFPMDSLQPFLRRFDKNLRLSGKLFASMQGRWDAGSAASLAGVISAEQCSISAPFLAPALGAKSLTLDRLRVPCKLAFGSAAIRVDELQVDCDVGHAEAKGTYQWAQSPWKNLIRGGHSLTVDVDLVKLAAHVPDALPGDLRLTEGKVHAECQSVGSGSDQAWTGQFTVGDVRAIRGDRAIQWPAPAKIDVRVSHLQETLPTIDKLHCVSDVLDINGSSAPGKVHVQGTVDVDRLAQRLADFVDLGNTPPQGQVSFQLVGEKKAFGGAEAKGESFQLNAAANCRQFAIALAPGRIWQEPFASVQCVVQGRQFKAAKLIDQAYLKIESGQDSALVQVYAPEGEAAEAQPKAQANRVGKLYCKLLGDLGRWQNRLMPFVAGLDQVQIRGNADIQGWMDWTGNQGRIERIEARANSFVLRAGLSPVAANPAGASLIIDESTVGLDAIGNVDLAKKTVLLTKAQVRAGAVVVDSEQLFIDLNTAAIVGNLGYRADLASLRRWFAEPGNASGLPVAGHLDGTAQIDTRKALAFRSQNTLANFLIGRANQPLYHDPHIQADAEGTFNFDQDRIDLESFEVATQVAKLKGKGHVASLSSSMELSSDGTCDYDLKQFEPMLRGYLGADAQIEGKGTRAFQLAGPLRSPKTGVLLELTPLHGRAALAWKRIRAYGAEVGTAEVKARLEGGWVDADPVVASINGGIFRATPRLRLTPEPMEMTVVRGKVIDKAEITPAMCASALGYALPALANVLEAEGKLSFDLDEARIPLLDPNRATIKGKLLMHYAKVGPGALVKNFSGLVRIPSTYSVIKENAIPVRLENGRVYHQDLRMEFPDNFIVTSAGSVGLDGSLQMTLDMPFPKNLIGNLSKTVTLPKQVRVPVAGTISQPRIDQRVLENVVREATRETIQGTIINGLEKLFNRK